MSIRAKTDLRSYDHRRSNGLTLTSGLSRRTRTDKAGVPDGAKWRRCENSER